MEKEQILGVNVLVINYDELRQSVVKNIKNNKKTFIVAINPEKILKARKNENLKELLNRANYPIADGIGVVLASKIRRGKIRKRITGVDSMDMLCQTANEKGYKVFLYGAKEEVVNSAKNNLIKKYPKMNIVGTINGYEKDQEKIIELINKSKADIIFVALGSPQQEEWINANMDKLCPKVFQGVGGAFDVISGKTKRAPKWIQKIGLEWFYRLIKEPKRIFRQIKLLKFLFLSLFYRQKS